MPFTVLHAEKHPAISIKAVHQPTSRVATPPERKMDRTFV